MSHPSRLDSGLLRSLLMGVVISVTAGCASSSDPQPRSSEVRAMQPAEQEQARKEAAQEAAAARAAEEQAAREEAERQARLEAQRREREEAERARLAAERQEAERREQEEAQRQAEAERREREAAQRQAQAAAAEREAAEQAAREADQQRAAADVGDAQAPAREQELATQQAAAEAEAAAAAQREAEQAAARRQAEADARQQRQQAAADEPTEAEAAAIRTAEARDAERARAAQSGAAVRYDQDIPTQAELARLGNELTPMGSVKAGNAAGTIPPWTGGITRPPSGYSVGDHHPDPFPGDRVQFVIDASNYQQYRDQLSTGQIAMFERYPDSYRMPVYQTRRSASFPQRVYEMTQRNASTGRLTPNGEGVIGVAEGFPFPVPKNGPQLIWNHKLKYKGVGQVRYNNQVAPTAGGSYTMIRLREEILGLYYRQGNTLEDIDNILLYFYQLVEGPARLAGNVLLVHETLNQTEQLRQAWIYNPGQRRVRRAPNVAYDNPGTASDGLRTNDMTDMFNGALDRYVWRLVGKKEMYVPYNSYKAHSATVQPDQLVRPGHLNPDLMRYELHRIWIVEANLKEGVRHINPKRVFYLDEDSYQILLTDHYDARGDLWRFSEAHSINYYDVPTFWSTIESHHDLQSGRYIAVGLDNQEQVNDFNFQVEPADFTPQSLRKRGRR